MSNWQTLLKQEIPHLFIYLESILQTGGVKNYRLYTRPIPFKNINQLSGYYYQIDEHEAMVGLGFSKENQSFVLYRKFNEDGQWVQRYDYFNSQGIYNYFSATLIAPLMEFDLLNMDPSCPIINLLYNYLAYEYSEAEIGTSRTDRVFSIEKFFQKIYHSDKIRLSIKDRSSDLAITQALFQINESEMDPVLNWEERRRANLYEYEKLDHVLRTKYRVHNSYRFLITIPLFFKALSGSVKRFFMRPFDNIKGIAFYWTIGQIFNTFKLVKNNPAISFMILSYAGFAYYYFTAPQNPYTAHIKTQIAPLLENPVGLLEDKIQTKLAATKEVGPVLIERNSPESLSAPEINSNQESLKAASENFEKGLDLPSQLGRKIEQDVKFSFALNTEAAWVEIENYQWKILKERAQTNSINASNYLANEYQRSLKAQIYLWESLATFVFENPDFILDKNNEQLKTNPYHSRAITLLDEMTKSLETKTKNKFPLPDGERVQALAQINKLSKKETKSIERNIKENSSVFQFKGSDEYRLAGKKQWEMLFIQSSRLDPHLKNGLEILQTQMRATAWTLERFYSLKSMELDLMSSGLDFENQVRSAQIKSSLENILHFYKINTLSIQKELPALAQASLSLEKNFFQSIHEAEILETTLINKNQMSGLQKRESKSTSRH